MPVDPGAAIEVTAYQSAPEMARGRIKDCRVRWALEEIGLAYRERLVGGVFAVKSAEHLADQPFGQVPIYKEAGLTLFESGAILVHIGEKDERLLPRDPAGRARAMGWAFAALNSVEPAVGAYFLAAKVSEGTDWSEAARAAMRPFAEARLAQLSTALGSRDWLEDRFTIGDLLMVDVLRAATPPDCLRLTRTSSPMSRAARRARRSRPRLPRIWRRSRPKSNNS